MLRLKRIFESTRLKAPTLSLLAIAFAFVEVEVCLKSDPSSLLNFFSLKYLFYNFTTASRYLSGCFVSRFLFPDRKSLILRHHDMLPYHLKQTLTVTIIHPHAHFQFFCLLSCSPAFSLIGYSLPLTHRSLCRRSFLLVYSLSQNFLSRSLCFFSLSYSCQLSLSFSAVLSHASYSDKGGIFVEKVKQQLTRRR